MAAQTIDSIYTQFRANFKDTPEFAIEYYQLNAHQLNNHQDLSSLAELKYYTELTWHYVNALFVKEQYNKTIDEADRKLNYINQQMHLLKDEPAKDDWYYGILFLKAMAQYKLRNFKQATPLLKRLVAAVPENDLYHKWLRDAQYGERLRIIHAIWAASAIILLFVLFFEEFIPSKELKLIITIIGFAGIAWNLFYEFYAKRSFRKSS